MVSARSSYEVTARSAAAPQRVFDVLADAPSWHEWAGPLIVQSWWEREGDPARPRVLRRERRPALAFGVLGRKFLLTPQPLENLEVFVAELDAGGATAEEAYTHGDSEELVVCLEGTAELHLGEDVHELGPGDSIFYRSSVPHRVVNSGSETTEVMWVISPPSL